MDGFGDFNDGLEDGLGNDFDTLDDTD